MPFVSKVRGTRAARRSILRRHLLSTTAALFFLTPICGAAQAGGGAGGASPQGLGGAGGVSNSLNPNGANSASPNSGGGGGGASGTGGAGGTGGGGAGGSGSSVSNGGNGGAGGLNGLIGGVNGASGNISGNNGAAGQDSFNNAGAGGGGAGGFGVLSPGGYNRNTGIILGGNGGHGGNAGNGAGPYGGGTSGGGGSGGDGGVGFFSANATNLANTGTIGGGFGAFPGQGTLSGTVGAIGGAGVSLGAGSSLTNSGAVYGGAATTGLTIGFAAYSRATTAGGVGGDGAALGANSNVLNSGTIRGGGGGYGSNGNTLGVGSARQFSGGAGGTGGAGVRLGNGSTLTNMGAGVIAGGVGGSAGFAGYGQAYKVGAGGDGGAGVAAGTNSTISNAGTIGGGTGGYGGSSFTSGITAGNGGVGGAGIMVGANSSVSNSGTISGGVGGTGGTLVGNGFDGLGAPGGAGVMLGAGSTLENASTGMISGGAGGLGGFNVFGYLIPPNAPGNGGSGVVAGTGSTIMNAGLIVGGNGSVRTADFGGPASNGGAGISAISSTIINKAGGSILGGNVVETVPPIITGAPPAANGAGGAGIIGSDLTINNAGTIAGGLAVDGVTRSYGLVFTGGANYVGGSGAINGGIDVTGTSIFQPALPGSPIGNVLQNVTGPLSFDPTATYQARIDATTADRASITGLATLNGASAVVIAGTGIYRAMTYTILTATGGVSGTFSTLSTNFNLAFLTPILSYDANDVYLSLAFAHAIVTTNPLTGQTVTVPNYAAAGSTRNQIAVAEGLTKAAILANDTGKVFTALNQLSVQQARTAFEDLSGEGITAARNAANRSAQQFNSTIFDQTTFYGAGAQTNSVTVNDGLPAGALGYAPGITDSPIKPRDPVAAAHTWRAWATGFGGADNYGGNAGVGSASQTSTIYGGALGIDYQLLPNYRLGLAVGGSEADFQVADRSTYGSVTGGHIAFYDIATFGSFYAASSNSFSYFGNKTTRNVASFGGLAGETDIGNFDSDEFRTRLEFGRHFDTYGATITPFVALEIAQLRSNGFVETAQSGPGNFLLDVHGQGSASVPAFLGARYQGNLALSGGMNFMPSLQLAYIHEFAPERSQIGALTALPGSTFLVDGARPSRNAAQVKLGGEFALSASSLLFANFDGEFAGNDQYYGGRGGFKFVW